MTDQTTRIPIIEEEAHLYRRTAEIERVSVRTTAEEEHVVLSDELVREQVEVTRVPVGREVAEAPLARTEGDLTIVPVVEERLVVEKRLFLVEEVHLRRTTHSDQVQVPVTLRKTKVEIDREKLTQEEKN